jgi:hypothetical protein
VVKTTDRLLSVRQVQADIMPGLGIRSVYAAIYRGDLPAVRYGKKILVREGDARKFVDGFAPVEPAKRVEL